jgi:hypothetical protein
MSINIDDFRNKALKEIDIPGFFDGDEPIKIKVKKPSMMAMMAQGKIPNTLMDAATQLTGENKNIKPENINLNDDSLQEIGKLMELYCIACMVEPTYEDIKDIMTDEQITKIFEFATGGGEKLKSFRK